MLGTLPEGRKAPVVTELTVSYSLGEESREQKSKQIKKQDNLNKEKSSSKWGDGKQKRGGEEALLGWEAEEVRAVTGNKNRPQGARSYRSS